MGRIRLLFVLALTVPFGGLLPAQDSASKKPKGAKAIVSSDSCVFAFPILETKDEWEWFVSRANLCEYSWMVRVKSDATYELGFSLYNPGFPSQSGTIAELIGAGQINVWELDEKQSTGKVVDGVKIKCVAEDGFLKIKVLDAKWSKRLFANKPKAISFRTSGALLKARRHTVKVTYDSGEDRKTLPRAQVDDHNQQSVDSSLDPEPQKKDKSE